MVAHFAIFGSFAGMTDYSYFKAPAWVDKSKPPGSTPQVPPLWSSWAARQVTTQAFFFGPTFVWFCVAVLVYVLFPYDLEAAKEVSLNCFLYRLRVNCAVTFLYTGFWHCSLYVWSWAERKFKPTNRPSFVTKIHNLWYTLLGCVQATVWEVIFVHLYASGKLPFISDQDMFSTRQNAVRTVLWALLIPVWRSTHFYFSHRLIHFRVLYKYVHSLHHRNIDIEPFAGLCMHPIEHLYYFSCLAPSLYFMMSPFHMLWNHIHLLLSPAASHSGWEDHMQSDQFHYLHHAKFECNYGSASVPLDHLFGTFREKLGKSTAYKGEGDKKNDGDSANEPMSGASKDKEEVKETSIVKSIFPKKEMGFYFIGSAIIFATFLAAAAASIPGPQAAVPSTLAALFENTPHTVSALLSFGPIVLGFFMRAVFGDSMPLSWPFHKERLGQFLFGMLMGVLVGVVPVYHTAITLLTRKGEAPYCRLWGCS